MARVATGSAGLGIGLAMTGGAATDGAAISNSISAAACDDLVAALHPDQWSELCWSAYPIGRRPCQWHADRWPEFWSPQSSA